MKHRIAAVLFATACACLGVVGAKAQPVRIMPFGDSITANGSDPESSYRYWLYQKLVNSGLQPNVDFVFIGHQNGVADGAPANSDFDQSYEGGDGWTSQNAADDANSAASLNPDIVLLEFGSNDIENPDLNNTAANLQQTIETFHNANPNVTILLAVPTPFVPNPVAPKSEQNFQKSQQSKLAGIVGQVASAEKKAGVRVIKVNLFSGFSARGDTKDGTHPNIRGEQKIASKFYSKLRPLL